MNTTINYYNLNAKNFIENTQNADMHLAQEKFLQLLPGSASILDFGCGSGRDTKYFLYFNPCKTACQSTEFCGSVG